MSRQALARTTTEPSRSSRRLNVSLAQLIHGRIERSEVVSATYRAEYCGLQCWTVQHPQDDGRTYFVNMIDRTCNCPDFVTLASGLGIDCKHLISVARLWEQMTGRVFVRQLPVSEIGAIDPSQAVADLY